MDNLKDKILNGLAWNLLEKVSIQVIQFVPSVLLARILSPTEFGLIGMLAIFIAITQIFLDSGFGVALIQKKTVSHTEQSSIFYFNIAVGLAAMGLMYLIAPWVGQFYGQPILVSLMRWLSVDLFITSLGLIQLAILTRTMNFKAIMKANLVASIVGGVLGVVAAYSGFGVWALVIQMVSNTICQTITLWVVCDWRPTLTFSFSALRGMFGFGSKMLATNVVTVSVNNLYQVIIGKFFSANSLGFYSRANSIKLIIIDTTAETLGKVLFPALSSIQNETERLLRTYRKAMILSTFLYFPLMTAFIVMAKPIFILLYSEKWAQSIPYFQIMCLGGLTYPMHMLNLNALKAKGRGDLYLNLTILRNGLIILNILITYRWGITAILIGQVILSFAVFFINSFYSAVLINYPVKKQIFDVIPSLLISLGMGLGIFSVSTYLEALGYLPLVILQVIIGFALYMGLNILFRTQAWSDMKEILKNLFPARLGSLLAYL